MKISRSNISLMLHWERSERTKQIVFAKENGLGLEVVGLSWPPLHNDSESLKNWIKEYRDDLNGFSNFLSFHGPIADVIPHSEDAAIRNIAYERVTKTIEIALMFDSKRIVFHSAINPVITDPNYYNTTIQEQGRFWTSILEKYPEIIICIENMWEPNSIHFKALEDECKHPRLRFCFDTGHFNVYGRDSLKKWFSLVGNSIVHFHLHDNPGNWDQHMPIGSGTFNWDTFFTLVEKPNVDSHFVLELMTLDIQKESLRWLNFKIA